MSGGRCLCHALALLTLVALATPPALAGPLGELRGPDGRVVSRLQARAGASLGSGAVQVASTRLTAGAVELRDVRVLGGQIRVARLVVPRHGVTGARVDGLRVAGRAVSAGPNTVVPLGGESYLVALQEAMTPGVGSGV